MTWQEAQGVVLARKEASEAGLTLIRRVDHQYTLRGLGWSLQLFPDDQRIYRGHDRGAPRFELAEGWTILDAVRGAIKAEAAERLRREGETEWR
jgi:hypothetical protein